MPTRSEATAAYLARLGVDAALPPTYDTLLRLHRAHLDAVPYENLGIMLGRPPSVDPGASLARVGAGGLGQAAVLPQHQPGQAGREHGVAAGDAAYGVEQLGARGGLHEVAGGACLDRVQDVLLLTGRGEDQHPGARVLLEHLGGDLDAVGARDLQVQDDDLRPTGREPRQRLVAVGGDADHVEARGREVALDRVSPHRVVVDHHHPDPGAVDGHVDEPNLKKRPRR